MYLDRHSTGCTCSYCTRETKLHYGLNIPSGWGVCNSWYVIKLWPGVYLRWTNRWFKKVKEMLL